ncbi:uncharacterized protein ppp1r3ab [Hypanus sabinus]|uniref:uncharacterized protein ppp1r3ab n=1 Tax=Hypanus sabinus TaxID=79690 RepID=UPI0028C3819F|nr:uncharacterized protein ppp1r3ab [Hypanus sabinus]XP_059834240.1 uncharacterized protein ppp1r3ab [Hypanus sabinus]
MEPAEKDRNPPFSVSVLGLPGDNEVFAEDDEIWFKPKSSPLPRRRSSSSDEGSQPPLNLSRKVSFADAFGLELVSVREYEKWDVGSCSVGAGAQDERAPQDECLLLPLFELPSSPEQLMQKLYAQKVELESTEFPRGANCMKGLIRVLNISYEKLVYIRMTLNNWESYYDILADYVADSCDGETDQFTFKILLVPPYLKDGAKVEFAIRYETQDDIYWANNDHKNYVILCHKKDYPIANEKPQEELDDRNLKSCLKTTHSKEILETSCDEGLTFLTSTEAQQENRKMILETKTVTQWNSEGHLNENREQKDVKREQLDPQMHPPLHISLTNSSSQEINSMQLEGLHCNIKVENEKNADIISESPISQQKDLEEYHINFASTSNYVEDKVKQDRESEWIGNSPNLETGDHGRDINTAKTADGTDIATSTYNIMTQSSELFAINGAHSQQRRNETFISHGNDISAKSQLEINRPLRNNPHSPSTDMQDNSVITEGAIGREGKLTTNTSNPTDLVQNSTGSENKSGEDNYLIGDSSLISASESFPVSAVCINTEPEYVPERIGISHNGSISSKKRQVFSASIADPKELSKCYSETENLKAIKPEDFSTKPFSQNKEAESSQDQNPVNRTEKMIPPMIRIAENGSTDKAVADVEKKDEGVTQIAEQSTRVLSRILADTMVKEAIEAALFEITGDEGKTFACESQKTKTLSNNTQPSKHKVTKVLSLTSRHGDPSKIHSIEEQNTRSCSQRGEHVTKTNTMHMQMEEAASNTPQRNTEEETAPGVSLPAWPSPLVSEKAVHPDVASSVEVHSVLQEKAGLPHELAGASEKVPGNIFGFRNCGLNQIHTEVGKQMAINLTDLTGEEGHYNEKRIKNVKSVKVTQNCNISEIDYTHNDNVLDRKGSLELAKVDVEKEDTSSTKDTLYDKTDKSEKFTQINNVTVVPQPAIGVVYAPDLTAEEKTVYEMSAECERADQDSCEIDNETTVEGEGETGDMFSESVDYFENMEMIHDTRSFPTNRSTIQHAAEPKVGTKPGSTLYTINETKGKNRMPTLPQSSELSNQYQCLDQAKLITTLVKENDGKETSTEVINYIYPNSEEIKFKECNEKPHKVEHVDEVCDSDVASIDSRLNSEPIANEITLKSTVWKVCYFVLFVVFLVTVYHYDFIGCFALYLFSLYWLCYEGETNSDPVRKD